ncbi:MAG: pyrroloquinoline quinone precursor peptide PqqA [Methylophaga sp.]|nr:MAG: pyrroloquinoline quinone precursor peptide PqqA [Methylophaga sp.]
MSQTDIKKREFIMWTTPEYSDMRFGFEVTMYICNR